MRARMGRGVGHLRQARAGDTLVTHAPRWKRRPKRQRANPPRRLSRMARALAARRGRPKKPCFTRHAHGRFPRFGRSSPGPASWNPVPAASLVFPCTQNPIRCLRSTANCCTGNTPTTACDNTSRWPISPRLNSSLDGSRIPERQSVTNLLDEYTWFLSLRRCDRLYVTIWAGTCAGAISLR